MVPPLLSVVIQTRNEEAHIAACIRSCKQIASEVVVVDMESTDNTKMLAEKLGARVVTTPYTGLVEHARQLALAQARSEWTLLLDADERITPVLRKFIIEYLKAPTHSVVSFPRKNIVYGKWMQHGLLWPDYQVRLFRSGEVVWPKDVHAEPKFSGQQLRLPPLEKFSIPHFYIDSLANRLKRNIDQVQHEAFYASQKKVDIAVLRSRFANEFSRRFHAYQGYEDGERGFIAAKLKEYYRFVEYVVYWEQHGGVDMLAPNQLRDFWDAQKQVEVLTRENRELRDAKFYRLYFWIKRGLQEIGLLRKRQS